jgi:hypothetical protein
MTTPITSIYVRPGSTSTIWSFANASVQTASGTSAITSVSLFLDSGAGQQMARGSFQYSVNGGSWTTYTLPTDSEGSWVPASATWRFVDTDSAEVLDAGNFTMHWKLADGSVASSGAAVMADDQPVGLVDASGSMLSTLHNGDTVTLLQAIDNGDPAGGRWVIEGQSQPGLFGLSTDASTGATKLVVANAAAMPALDNAATVTVHYYDHYQVDANGNPIANTGVSGTMAFNVVAGSSQALTAFGPDMSVGAANGAFAAPVLASLSNGSFAAAWQGSDSAILAQVRDATGNAVGAPIAITSSTDGHAETQPAIAALANGRFVVAYTVQDSTFSSHVAYRIVEANGSVGAEINATASSSAASMPAVTGLADGTFELAWADSGKLTMKHVDASGAGGAASTVPASGIVSSPDVVALNNGAYVVAWGQSDDGNVYAQVGGAGTVIQVTTDGAAANNLTAAPLPHVAALAGGGFVVAWDSYSNDTRGFSMSDIFFQRYDNAGNPLGAIEQANIDSGGGRFDAEIAATADGGFIIEWQGADADGTGIFGRRFAADGNAVDAHEFQVNQNAQGDQAAPALAAFANGGFASAWIDSAAGSSSIEARVLVGSGSGSSGSGSAGGSGGAVSPQPGGTTGSGSTGSSGSGSTGSTGSGSTDSGAGSTGGSTGSTGSTGSGSTGSGSTGSTGSGSTGSGSTGSTGSGSSGSGSTGSTGGSSGSTGSGGAVTTPTPEKLVGTGGANVFASGTGSHAIDGGDGIDTVTYTGAHTSFTITAGASGLAVTGGAGAVQDTLVNVERVQFTDVSLAFDVNGTAGQAYRLYQAAFDRAPDAAGLGYWIKALDSGSTLDQVAAGFSQSKEFADLYGGSTSASQFVGALYQNVLHRAGDSAGQDFWVAAIEQHGVSRESVLSHFSESVENQAQVIGTIQFGMQFLPWA